jgi:nucleoside-diphosphate-sugar epimerase
MVYGDPGSRAVDESFDLAGARSTPYACSKLNAENWLRNSCGRDDECLALRLCGFVEGGGNIDYMIGRALAGQPIELFSLGAVCRDYLSLDDGVLALLKALESPPRKGFQAVNVGSGQSVTTAELAAAICNEIGSRSEVVLLEQPAPRADFVYDITRAREALKFEPGVLLDAVRRHARNVARLARWANG